ncbi:hypothetical protein RvY_12761-2 [Ramazzottius varieornatus]|uniref:Uncharacterized protein n=1 Tax=Ramazzottius varieornatus TaxID=947166 RepID=A0A1D1VKL2_RAMVA|nr:hypothetical protein RvY_12761-2 [Ramazzottius varieornatus]
MQLCRFRTFTFPDFLNVETKNRWTFYSQKFSEECTSKEYFFRSWFRLRYCMRSTTHSMKKTILHLSNVETCRRLRPFTLQILNPARARVRFLIENYSWTTGNSWQYDGGESNEQGSLSKLCASTEYSARTESYKDCQRSPETISDFFIAVPSTQAALVRYSPVR